MQHSAILSIVAAAAAGAPEGERLTLDRATDRGTKVTLTVDRALSGPRPERSAAFAASVDNLVVRRPDGRVTTQDLIVQMPVRVAVRPARPLSLATDVVKCGSGLTIVGGTALANVAKVRLVHADGHRTPLRLRAAPGGWDYDGSVLGAVVRAPSRIVAAVGLDGRGRTVQKLRLPKPNC